MRGGDGRDFDGVGAGDKEVTHEDVVDQLQTAAIEP